MKTYKKRISIAGKKIIVDFPVGYERVKIGLIEKDDIVFVPYSYIEPVCGVFEHIDACQRNDRVCNYLCVVRKAR